MIHAFFLLAALIVTPLTAADVGAAGTGGGAVGAVIPRTVQAIYDDLEENLSSKARILHRLNKLKEKCSGDFTYGNAVLLFIYHLAKKDFTPEVRFYTNFKNALEETIGSHLECRAESLNAISNLLDSIQWDTFINFFDSLFKNTTIITSNNHLELARKWSTEAVSQARPVDIEPETSKRRRVEPKDFPPMKDRVNYCNLLHHFRVSSDTNAKRYCIEKCIRGRTAINTVNHTLIFIAALAKEKDFGDYFNGDHNTVKITHTILEKAQMILSKIITDNKKFPPHVYDEDESIKNIKSYLTDSEWKKFVEYYSTVFKDIFITTKYAPPQGWGIIPTAIVKPQGDSEEYEGAGAASGHSV